MVIKVTKIPNRLTNDLNKLQKYENANKYNKIPSLWLLKSDISLLVHRPERGEQMYAQYWINIENAVF